MSGVLCCAVPRGHVVKMRNHRMTVAGVVLNLDPPSPSKLQDFLPF